MAKPRTDHVVVFLFFLSIPLFLLLNSVIAGRNGFSMKLIHRDSIESPLYPGNLTQQERIRRSVEQSKARVRYLAFTKMAASGYKNQTDLIEGTNGASLPTIFDGHFYLTYVGIGSFYDKGGMYYNYYYLILDTVTDLIWLQCEGCTSCFPQAKPYFPYKNSSSYRPLPCNDTLCETRACSGTTCSYDTTYRYGIHTKGVLGTERFTVGLTSVFSNVVFGCGLDQRYFRGFTPKPRDKIAGVLGMGRGRNSFLTQTGYRGGDRFSYCLQTATEDIITHTYLRFGEDAKIEGPDVHTISMNHTAPGFYYLNLEGISVDGKRVPLPIGTNFEVKTNKQGQQIGGCIIDTATQYSIFYSPIYEAIKDRVVVYYISKAKPPERLMGVNEFGFELCYFRQKGFDDFPSFTFHFTEADFPVDPRLIFYITDQIFCLAINANYDESFDAVIGSWHTVNHRILYDVKNSELSFAKEFCVSGS